MSLNLTRIQTLTAQIAALAGMAGGFSLGLELPRQTSRRQGRAHRVYRRRSGKAGLPGAKLARKALEGKAGAHH
jgi:hypothetical protein